MFIAVRPHVKYSAKRPTRPRRPVLRAVEGIAPFDSLRSLRAGAPRCESQRLARRGDARAARGLLYPPAAAASPFAARVHALGSGSSVVLRGTGKTSTGCQVPKGMRVAIRTSRVGAPRAYPDANDAD